MKQFFKKIWEFIKRLLHIGAKAAAKEAENIARARLEEELAELSKQIETATGAELEYIRARIGFIHSLLLKETKKAYDEAVEKLMKKER